MWAFTDLALENGTFLFPITDNGMKLANLVIMDSIMPARLIRLRLRMRTSRSTLFVDFSGVVCNRERRNSRRFKTRLDAHFRLRWIR
jgi:hypothetical protein